MRENLTRTLTHLSSFWRPVVLSNLLEVSMTTSLKGPNRTLGDLPAALRREGAINLEVEQGVIILRASKAVQNRIESLLHKQQTAKLTRSEKKELQQYEQIDDYLSLLNRLSRNLAQSQKAQEAAGAP
jgi:uncharacterized protein YnzC (UPF0291/DUF896 family)